MIADVVNDGEIADDVVGNAPDTPPMREEARSAKPVNDGML